MENPEFVFQELKSILIEYSESMIIAFDEKDNFYLNTHHIMTNKKPMYFGSTKINKNYVSFHLMPVYVFPELLDDISPELKKRMQGKSCFNFKDVNRALFAELKTLAQKGYSAYSKAGYL